MDSFLVGSFRSFVADFQNETWLAGTAPRRLPATSAGAPATPTHQWPGSALRILGGRPKPRSPTLLLSRPSDFTSSCILRVVYGPFLADCLWLETVSGRLLVIPVQQRSTLSVGCQSRVCPGRRLVRAPGTLCLRFVMQQAVYYYSDHFEPRE